MKNQPCYVLLPDGNGGYVLAAKEPDVYPAGTIIIPLNGAVGIVK